MSRSFDSDEARSAALQREIDDAQEILARLRADIVGAQELLADSASAQLLEANEQLVLAMVVAQDEVATSAAALETLSQSADRDPLTGLPNRSLLHDRFAQAAANARRHGKRMAIVFIDLDEFKDINDTLGHAVGDEVLVAAAARLTRCVRQADTVSRHGGDEFLILLSEVSAGADAGAIAQKMLTALAEPLVVRGRVLQMGASIGISVYPDDAASADDLIERADEAMYRAKQRGGTAFEFFGGGPRTEPVSGEPMRSPRTRLRQALVEQEHKIALLREANELLVVAALGAQDLKDAADRALARHHDYLTVLGHELRSPLSPLLHTAQILDRGPHGEAALAHFRRVIERQVVQIARLVNDMLALSRTSRAQLDVVPEVVDIVALAGQAVDACMPSVAARRQTLELDTDMPVHELHADPVRIVQVIANLVDNASKYTPASGHILVQVRGTFKEVTVLVRDNGMGISAAGMRTLFEPFARAPEALTSGSTGMGIGLTVVRQLVAAHRGTVEVRSDGPGRGAEFVVRLPRGEAP